MCLFQLTLSCLISVQVSCISGSMKLDTPEFYSVLTPELETLAAIFEKYGFKDQLRIVGGAVRDLLCGKKPADLDLATTATPAEMKDMFNAEGVRMFNTKGEKHGTVTVRIRNKENFEITTLRDDVVTDGRHAIVQFTKDWFVDATRRDLTINAMYLDLEGNLYDFYNGYEDLKNNKVVFVGDADKRIKEDYLRILRYFRFFGRMAKDPHNHDQKTLQAIRYNAPGLDKISGERIWSELQRILTGNFANEIVKIMLDLGLAQYIGLSQPDDLDITCFNEVCHNNGKYSFKAVTFIASLLRKSDEVTKLHKRLKLSAFERDLAYFIVDHKNVVLPTSNEECIKHFQRILVFTKMHPDVIRAFVTEFLKVMNREAVINKISDWEVPVFPLDGNVLVEKGIRGAQLGLVMKELKEKWIDSDFVFSDTFITNVVDRLNRPNKV